MEYEIIIADNSNTLAGLVNSYLKDGWELHGGVAMAFIRGAGAGLYLSQAMVKRNETQ